MRAPVRRARAMESDGRAETSVPEVRTSVAKNTPSLTSVMRTSSNALPVASSTSLSRSWVSGRGGVTPCWANAMAVASTAPIQIGR